MEHAGIGPCGVSGEAGCRPYSKGEQKPAQTICRHPLRAQWPVGVQRLPGELLPSSQKHQVLRGHLQDQMVV